jgi:hypothetical protein
LVGDAPDGEARGCGGHSAMAVECLTKKVVGSPRERY